MEIIEYAAILDSRTGAAHEHPVEQGSVCLWRKGGIDPVVTWTALVPRGDSYVRREMRAEVVEIHRGDMQSVSVTVTNVKEAGQR